MVQPALYLILAYLLPSISFVFSKPVPSPTPRPLVLWHGLGDSYASPGMLEFANEIKDVHPGIFIHSIYIDKDIKEDQRAGWFGNVNEHLEKVNEQLLGIPELAGGFDGLGFSQGGQFLRAFVERYNNPPVHNLITFGSQHMGVSDIPGCKPGDVFCFLARNAVKRGVYSSWAQENLIQAQYFRDERKLLAYLAANHFLTSINNELPAARNSTYYENFSSLSNFVMILFSDDKTVVPKESSWFGSYAPPEEDGEWKDNAEKVIIPMRLQPLYTEDWIGLRKLDKSGRLVLESCEGEHMHLRTECWKPIVKRFCGGIDDDGTKDALVIQE